MTSHLAEAGRTLIPRKDDRYGLLSPALVILTFVAGLVDALSYLALGHVFVANVTGTLCSLVLHSPTRRASSGGLRRSRWPRS